MAAICRYGSAGASAFRSSGTCRLASEMISSACSTARRMPQFLAKASKVAPAATSRIPAIASRISHKRSRMPRGTSEHAQCLGFDPVAQHKVQAGPRYHVGLRAEDIADTILHVDQFDEAEAGVICVEEQIDVAVRSCLLAGDGAEQVEPGDACLVQIGLVRAKLRNDSISTTMRWCGSRRSRIRRCSGA